jgi:hypothetical protein
VRALRAWVHVDADPPSRGERVQRRGVSGDRTAQACDEAEVADGPRPPRAPVAASVSSTSLRSHPTPRPAPLRRVRGRRRGWRG